MQTLNGYANLEAEAQAAAAPAPASLPALLASAAFAAGVGSLLLLQAREPAAEKAAEPSAAAVPEAASVPVAAPSVLAPFTPSEPLTRQTEDGLVAFSGYSPIVNEGPVLPAAPQPVALVAAAPVPPAIERVLRRPTLAAMAPLIPIVKSDVDADGLRRSRLIQAARSAAFFPNHAPAARRVAAVAAALAAAPKDLRALIADGRAAMRQRMGAEAFRKLQDQEARAVAARAAAAAGTKVAAMHVISYGDDGPKMEVRYANGVRKVMDFDPLVFDLDGKGVRTTDRAVRFDLSGDGRMGRVHDIGSGVGVLVFDPLRSGVAGGNGRALFGDRTDLDGSGRMSGFRDGYEALEGLVRKAEKERVLPAGTFAGGRLDSRALAALGKAYGLGIRRGSLAGRTLTLAEAGVKEIRLSAAPSQRRENFDDQGSSEILRPGAAFVRADGTTGAYADVVLSFETRALDKLIVAR